MLTSLNASMSSHRRSFPPVNPTSPSNADDVVAERFPNVAALAPFNRAEAHDELFEIGLRAIVSAIHTL